MTAGKSGRKGPLAVERAAHYVGQAALGLQYAHEAAGMVHRDVKPANLLLHPTGRGRPHLLLSDFGIAAPVAEPRLTRASSPKVLSNPSRSPSRHSTTSSP